MTTLITGATGLVGGHIARALSARGEKLRLLMRPKSSREGLEGVRFEEVHGDVRDLESLRRATDGADKVIHAAGSTRVDPFAAEYQKRVNVEGTRNVLTACAENAVKRLLHVSSVAAVGAGTLERPADESMSWNLAHKGPYWTTKRAAEQLVQDAVRRGDVDAVIINPAYVLGSYDVKPSSGGMLLQIASGLMLVYPSGGNAFVDARDVAQGALLALDKGARGERYVLSGENLTYRELFTLAARELGVRPPMVPLPRWLALGAARAGDLVGPRFPKAFAYFNSSALSTLFELNYGSWQKARRELGYSPRPVAEAVRDAVAWFRSTGRLRAPIGLLAQRTA
jgi:dihydroflavonol-4-reductase